MVSLFFVKKFLTALATSQENLAGAHLPRLPEEISRAESLLACFESHEETLFEWIRQRREA